MDNKDKKENIEIAEGVPVRKPEVNIEKSPEQILERSKSRENEIVSAELRKEIEMMELDDSTKAEAEKTKEKIEFLGEKEKIEHLLQIAREKGLVFAIQVARKMNEPYLLDILHDTLAQEGFYKDFTK